MWDRISGQVSRIAQLLDAEVPGTGVGEYWSWPTTRRFGVQDLAILKAIGVNCWGKREVLGVSVALSEAEVHWREFLQSGGDR